MALTSSSSDDGFREIQLNGKQLVFLFMAVTVVLVVTFLTGVLVGRGVRAERAIEQATAAGDETPAPPDRGANVTPAPGNDPTKALPPAGAEGEPDSGLKAASPAEDVPPVAVIRSNSPSVAAAPADVPKAAATPAKSASAPAPVSKAPAAASSTAAPPKPAPAPAAANAPASAGAPTPPSASAAATPTATTGATRDGYAVQVAAVNAKSEADSIKNRLSAKGYAAYVEEPKGSQKMFRVRVGTFKSRSEAVTVADKLKKEEKFKPWVTR